MSLTVEPGLPTTVTLILPASAGSGGSTQATNLAWAG